MIRFRAPLQLVKGGLCVRQMGECACAIPVQSSVQPPGEKGLCLSDDGQPQDWVNHSPSIRFPPEQGVGRLDLFGQARLLLESRQTLAWCAVLKHWFVDVTLSSQS